MNNTEKAVIDEEITIPDTPIKVWYSTEFPGSTLNLAAHIEPPDGYTDIPPIDGTIYQMFNTVLQEWEEDPEREDRANIEAEIMRIKSAITERDYRALKAFKLGVQLDDLYPGETDWYKTQITRLNELEEIQEDRPSLNDANENKPDDEECIIAGELPVPDGYVVQDDKLISITIIEQQATAELNRRLGDLNSEESKARAEIDEDYAAERKSVLLALLAVKQQPDWPLDIDWPEMGADSMSTSDK